MDWKHSDTAGHAGAKWSLAPAKTDPTYGAWVKNVAEISARYPELSVRLWAEGDGMHVSVLLYPPGPRFGRPCIQLCDAVWQPDGVTEEQVLEWARRAISKALADRLAAESD